MAEGADVSADLRLGRWERALADVRPDCLIVDAPYSLRVHVGHDNGHAMRPERAGKALDYDGWDHDNVCAFVDHWSPRTSGWICTITDHELARSWEFALKQSGRYVFAPIPCVEIGSRVRLLGDGPSSWTCWMMVAARPRSAEFMRWGALCGAYVVPGGENGGKLVTGGKPLWLMRAIVRDYSRPGDLICDPCAGGGTTLLAALMEGRRAVGAEMDPKHYEIARKRLASGYTPTLFHEERKAAEQVQMFGDEKGE